MEKINELLEAKLLPVAEKISTNIYISSLRDGFAAILPAMLIGSFLTLLLNFPITAVSEFLISVFGSNWNSFVNSVYNATIPLISLFATITITYYLTQKIEGNIVPTVMLNTMLYFMFLPGALYTLEDGTAMAVAGSYSTNYMGAKGFFLAILLGLAIPPIFKRLCNSKHLVIKLPDSVPPTVWTSFLVMIPTVIILMIAGVIQVAVSVYASSDVFTIVYETLQTPMREIIGTSYFGGVINLFFTYLAWFFGIHGGLLMSPINNVIYGELMPANIAAFAAGESIPYFMVGSPFFEIYTKMGGGGNVLALITAIFLVGKTEEFKGVAKAGVVPALFNISEPIVFGLPIVFNPIILIPFLIAPMACYSLAYLASVIGIAAPIVIQVPWTIPMVINVWLSTAGSIPTVLLQIALFILSVVIYIPFVRINEKANMKAAEKAVAEKE